MRRLKILVLLSIWVTIALGCSSVNPKKEFLDLQKKIEPKTMVDISWDQKKEDKKVSHQKAQMLLRNKLTADEAVEIALLQNPSLQASFEEIGIAKADMVEMSLLSNPSLSGFVRQPDDDGKTNTEFEIKQDVLSVLTFPLRRRLAKEQLEVVKYAVGETILHLDNEVRSAYYTLQAAEQMVRAEEKNLQAAKAAMELAERQIQAGNINDLEWTVHKVSFHQAKMDLMEKENEARLAREDLGRLMGLASGGGDWEIFQELSFLSATEPSLEELEEKAISQNFELAKARQEIRVKERGLTASGVNQIPEISAGFNTERESRGERLSGAVFEVDIPVFDQKRAPVARSRAELRQSQRQFEAQEAEVRTEIRKIYTKLLNTRNIAEEYRNILFPLQTKFVDSLQKHYNFMLVGVYDLLEAKKEEVEMYHRYTETLKEYWILRSDLEHLIAERIVYIPYDKTRTEKQTDPDVGLKTQTSQEQKHHNHGSHGGDK